MSSPYAQWSHLVVSLEMACSAYPLAPLLKLRVCCDFLNWLFFIDDLSDDMEDKSTDAMGNEVMTTYHQPHAYDPETHVGKLAKRFVPIVHA